MAIAAALCLQVLLAFEAEGPVRFGHPLPASALPRGLRLQGGAGAVLQWRPLQAEADPRTGRVWVELAVAGASGRVTVVTGGAGPSRDGPAWAATDAPDEPVGPGVVRRRRVRTWATGERDVWERLEWSAAGELAGEWFAAGEALTLPGPGHDARAAAARIGHRDYRRAGLLPQDEGLGAEIRGRLLAASARLRELPGLRGAGDYGRSGDVVTNLEFDTALALARLSMATGRRDLLLAAWRSARHLVDRDLDRRSGLPFPHGPGHRTGVPEPGHAWLQGLLLVGCLCADDELIAAAGSVARSIARQPPRGRDLDERARESAWPLLELETWLRFRFEPAVAEAADALAASIAARWDPGLRTFRFGEGGPGPVHLERAWITGGIVLPALQAHLSRRPDPELHARVQTVERRLGQWAATGLPTHWRQAGSDVFGEHRECGDPRAHLMLEGLAPDRLRVLLPRARVRTALGAAPDPEDPDLATSFTMIARCSWIYR